MTYPSCGDLPFVFVHVFITLGMGFLNVLVDEAKVSPVFGINVPLKGPFVCFVRSLKCYMEGLWKIWQDTLISKTFQETATFGSSVLHRRWQYWILTFDNFVDS